MGFDVAEWTPRVLTDGLPDLPEQLEPGQTIAVALWRGQRHGAVLYVRLWRNGQIDCDTAITRRAADGSWEEPDAWGGGPWIDDPLHRSTTGWRGEPVIWKGINAIEGACAVRGAATASVSAIAVEQNGESWDEPIDSPCGAFLIGLENPGHATLRGLGQDGLLLSGEAFGVVAE